VETGEGFRDSIMVRSGEVDLGCGKKNAFRFLRGIECSGNGSSADISSALRLVSSADSDIETRRGGAFASSSVMATAAMIAMRSCPNDSSACLQGTDSVATALDSLARERGELKAGTVVPEGDTSGSSESLG
jgi:hypothetical protein